MYNGPGLTPEPTLVLTRVTPPLLRERKHCMTRITLSKGAAAAVVLVSTLVPTPAATLPDDPRQVERGRQLTLTKSKADVDGDRHPETLILVNAMTG